MKKFLVIGNGNAVAWKDVFPKVKDNEVRIRFLSMSFQTPDGEYQKFGNFGWFTNISSNTNPPLELTATYSPENYPKYDDYDAINCDRTADIPADYFGEMGVPISFLDKYCPEQFEIIGVVGMGTQVDGFLTSFIHLNGEKLYARLIIRRRR